MKAIIIIINLWLIAITALTAQSPPHIQDAKRCNNWGFGYGSFVNVPFNGQTKLNVPSHTQKRIDSYVDFDETNTHISDSLGNLMFYANGIMIADTTHHIMMGCDTLNPGYWANSWSWPGGYRLAQGILSLPFPNHPNLYYVFHTRTPDPPNVVSLAEGVYYTIVDMNGNNGLGSVTSLRNPIIQNYPDGFSVRLTACRHANGRDWWVVLRALTTDAYATMLLSPQGVSSPVWHNAMLAPQSIATANSFYSQSCFSPDGTKFVYHTALNDFGNYITLYDFDRCNGLMSNPRFTMVNDSTGEAGVGFSPSSQYLYFNTATKMFQVDVTSATPFTHIDTVAILDNFVNGDGFRNYFARQQLGDDNKIYIRCIGGNKYMHTINNPDAQGRNCNLQQHSIVLQTRNGFSLPLAPYFGLGPLDGSSCDTLGIDNVVSTPPPLKPPKGEFAVRVYPNPANDILNIEIPQNGVSLQYKIYDVLGRELQNGSLPSFGGAGGGTQIALKNINNGIYYLSIYQNSELLGSSKFVVQHE